MRVLTADKRASILRSLIEGNSIRSTARMTGAAKDTVLKLLCDAGAACLAYQRATLHDLDSERIQCDEIWCFCQCKQKNIPEDRKGVFGIGDVWTWVALDADSKLVPTWLVGRRDTDHAIEFMRDLAGRLTRRIQLTTDGFHPYREAVGWGFRGDVDYAMLVKQYASEAAGAGRYSPPRCIGAVVNVIRGNPNPEEISTSYSERQNLSMRMGMRRFTRLTNAFSKKIENLEAAIALYFFHYNFIRRHMTLRVTPAMKAGVTNRLWTMNDLVNLI